MKQSLYFDDVACVDYETHWAADYTLTSKKVSMTEYIRSERFEAQSCAIRLYDWAEPQQAYGKDIPDLLASIDWSRTAFLAHHAHFDGLISTHHFGHVCAPVFWLDTMSMSRMIYGVDVNHSFAALSARLGMKGKVHGDVLKGTKGKYLVDFTPEERRWLGVYNIDDCHDTLEIYKKIAQHVTLDELRIIDATLRMYTEPVLELDEDRLAGLHEREVARRANLVEEAETTAKTLGSAPKFADLLRSLGVVPPMKISPTTGQPTYAFAKTDLDFKELLDHPDERVRKAVQARLGSKGSIVETRSRRLLSRVGLPTPVYLAPAAARTLRWGGGDLSNWQNLPSTGDGANLRRAILAPEGCKIIGADASQVEVRKVAWLTGFTAKMDAFRAYDRGEGPDMYCVSASGVYGREIDKHRDPFERFIGKVFELSCQYGAGAPRVQNTLKQGFRGAEPVHMPLMEVKQAVERWRRANQPIIDGWDALSTIARRAWIQDIETEYGPVVFERFKDDGFIHLPNGTFMRYPQVGWSDSLRSVYYNSRNGAVKLWGGHLLENISQALCAVLLKHHMLQIMDLCPHLRLVLLVHDEVVSVAEDHRVEEYAAKIKEIMSTPAPWCADMPLNAAVSSGEYYDKA